MNPGKMLSRDWRESHTPEQRELYRALFLSDWVGPGIADRLGCLPTLALGV